MSRWRDEWMAEWPDTSVTFTWFTGFSLCDCLPVMSNTLNIDITTYESGATKGGKVGFLSLGVLTGCCSAVGFSDERLLSSPPPPLPPLLLLLPRDLSADQSCGKRTILTLRFILSTLKIKTSKLHTTDVQCWQYPTPQYFWYWYQPVSTDVCSCWIKTIWLICTSVTWCYPSMWLDDIKGGISIVLFLWCFFSWDGYFLISVLHADNIRLPFFKRMFNLISFLSLSAAFWWLRADGGPPGLRRRMQHRDVRQHRWEAPPPFPPNPPPNPPNSSSLVASQSANQWKPSSQLTLRSPLLFLLQARRWSCWSGPASVPAGAWCGLPTAAHRRRVWCQAPPSACRTRAPVWRWTASSAPAKVRKTSELFFACLHKLSAATLWTVWSCTCQWRFWVFNWKTGAN